jgi:predicted transcriptional regulator
MPIRKSVTEDHIVDLEDGQKLKMLKRHLMTNHGLTPERYRLRWASSRITQWWRRTLRPAPGARNAN